MSANYKKLGEIVELIDERNRDGKVQNLIGVSIDKCFIKSVANTIGTDLTKYQVIRKNDFACSLMQVSRDGKIPIACLKDYDEAIMSPAYYIFRIKNTNEVLPDYLAMWFMRTEFDREASYIAVGGVRGSMPWEDFCDMKLPVPDLREQEKIVNTYNAITKRIQLKQKINENLEKTAQAIFKKTFEEKLVSNQKKVPLSELCLIVTKGTTPTTLGYDFTKEGINFLKGESITDAHFFDNTKFDHINDEANQALKRSIIFENDILFSMAGTIGKFAIADKMILPANTNQAVCIIRCNSKLINPLYVYSFLIGNWHIEYYTRRIQEAVQANLSLENIKSLPIILLDDKERKNYEKKIFPLFERILNNNKEIIKLQNLKQLIISRISGM